MANRQGHRGFGHLRKLPSGRWQGSYIGPDMARHTAPHTFTDKDTATAWLRNERSLMESGDDWTPPKVRAERKRVDSFAVYSAAWLAQRPVKPRTKVLYERILDRELVPAFGDLALRHITPEGVRAWFAGLDDGKARPTPTANAHAYALLRSILATAVTDDILAANPCRIRGAGQTKRVTRPEVASPAQVAALIEEMPEQYKAITVLAAWCGLRQGEALELRRSDIDLKSGTVHVRRAVILLRGTFTVGSPKSGAGVRDVVIPAHVLPLVKDHIIGMGVTGKDALLFPAAGDPAKHLHHNTLRKAFKKAADAAGLPEGFRWHDLRHSCLTNAAQVGATLADLMRLAGHSTAAAAMRYQHTTAERPAEIAARLSELAEGAR